MKIKGRISMVMLSVCLIFVSCERRNEQATDYNEKGLMVKAIPFSPNEVTLLDGPFKQASELNKKVLLSYKPDRFLSKFRIEAGLPPHDDSYGGWENESIAGHSLGHYLSACALVYKSDGDTAFLNRINYITNELFECQQAHGNGYIGAVAGLKDIFEKKIAKGEIVSHGFDIYGIWAPFYTMHKQLAGLIDVYKFSENEKALVVAKSFADWIASVLRDLNEGQMQEILKCEFGGINESLAELYTLTGDQKYLDLAQRFYHKEIYTPLVNNRDNLNGKHGNTQLAKMVGQARIHEITNDSVNKKMSLFFWDRVVNHHSYVTGGNCDHEHFSPSDSLNNFLSEGTTETCNVYNMLKLSDHLFTWNQSVKYADYYERALFNHILSSQNPVDGRVIYNLSLKMGGHKVYQEPDWFTCCVGSGMENHSRYNSSIYFHADDVLYVNQYIASELNWKEKGVVIKQATQYPSEQGSMLSFHCNEPVRLTLNIRYPSWAKNGIEISVNGKLKRVDQKPGSYIAIDREWEEGDIIEIKLPFSLHTEAMPDNPNRVAIMYGPLVLAGVLGQIESNMYRDALYVPVLLLKGKKLTDCIIPVVGEANTFVTTGIGRPRDIKLKPFYSTHDVRYSVYWDIFDEKGWELAKIDYAKDREANNRMEEMTVDFLQPGEMQSERDHQFSELNSSVGELKNRKFREVSNGWFSCTMGVYQGQPMALVIDYRGGSTGLKTFDILVNDRMIATEDQTVFKEEIFKSVQYEIPDNLTFDQSSITVKFVPHNGNSTGPIFGVRTIRR